MSLRKISLSPLSMKIETRIKNRNPILASSSEFPKYASRLLLNVLEIFSENATIITEGWEL